MHSSGNTPNAPPIPRRKSAFVETGLGDDNVAAPIQGQRPTRSLRFNSKPDIFEYVGDEDTSDHEKQATAEREKAALQRARWQGSSIMYRLTVAGFVLAILIPLLQGRPWVGSASIPSTGVEGGPIKRDAGPVLDAVPIAKRQGTSPTDMCFRWAHMTALVNGTLYIYGGRATPDKITAPGSWNNNLLTLDLTKSWQITQPPLTGLPQPSGPPKVALGSLWHSYDSLYLYGGQYTDDQNAAPVTPDPFSLWAYSIADGSWTEHDNPRTSEGTASSPAETAVERAAEGSGISVPALGRGWYFGGHLDEHTSAGWSNQIPRVYLTSLLEYNFPGTSNDQVQDLSDGRTAGSDGVWRNITDAGTQATNGFPERADSALVYVPGYGAKGILVGMAGGQNDTFQQMNQIDVFDIATSEWYKQATSGTPPIKRVNTCTVVASAPDGSSQNIYMFGGQNLQPAAAQTQYDDMWILTLPSFTWIEVDQTDQSIPSARAGHTCDIWNGQMIVVGGYVGTDVSCDSPGVYTYDMSNLKWTTEYRDLSSTNPDASIENNPLNQQPVQRNVGGTPDGLQGNYGYAVPAAVQKVVGGGPTGGATVTTPVQMPTDGPMKTGQPVIYTVTTTADGTVVTETAATSASSNKGNKIAAIVASVVAGVFAIVIGYMAFCLWLYRKRLALYKRHAEMAQRGSWGGEETPFAGHYGGQDSGNTSDLVPTKNSSEGSPFVAGSARTTSHTGSGKGSRTGSGSPGEMRHAPGGKSTDDLLSGGEPSFWGTMLSPKRSLRVTNSD